MITWSITPGTCALTITIVNGFPSSLCVHLLIDHKVPVEVRDTHIFSRVAALRYLRFVFNLPCHILPLSK